MKKLHFSIMINASREKVWKTMLADATYRIWTTAFMPGSYVEGSGVKEGNWKKGGKMKFLAPDKDGKLGGMTSEIAENKPNEFISIHHLGIVADGIEDTTSEEAKQWQGFENYTLNDRGGKTELVIDVDTKDDFVDYMNDSWKKALETLKELAEK